MPVRFALLKSAPLKFAEDLLQPLQSTAGAGRASHFDEVVTGAGADNAPEAANEVGAAGVGLEVDVAGAGAEVVAAGAGAEVVAAGAGAEVDAVGLAVVGQYDPGGQGSIVAAVLGQYDPGEQGSIFAAETVAVGVGEEIDAGGESDAVSGAANPFITVLVPPVSLLVGDAASVPPHAESTSAPARSATPAMALPERQVAAGTARIAYPQSSAFQPGKKTVSRKVSGAGWLLRHRSQRV